MVNIPSPSPVDPKFFDTRNFLRIEAYMTPTAALPAWRELEAANAAGAYQSAGFVLPWYDCYASTKAVAPLILIGYDFSNHPVLLLPLVLKRFGGLAVAQFAGGKHSNLNAPVVRPDFAFSSQEAYAFLQAAALAAPVRPDLFAFMNQPVAWRDRMNPFAALQARPSPSFAYGAELGEDIEAFLKMTDSGGTRKKLRVKASKLAMLGQLRIERAVTPSQIDKYLAVYIAQKTFRLKQMRKDLHSVDGLAQRFYRLLASSHGVDAPMLDLYALFVGDQIVATAGGLPGGQSWHGLFNSFDPTPEFAKSSPGELLLRGILRDLGARGFRNFDLGVGEARYKSAISNQTIELADSLAPITAAGAALGALEHARLGAKSWVKRTPWALKIIGRLRG